MRTAVVTGAARRVGQRIVRALLDDGWAVVAHVHRPEDEVEAGACKVVADLAEADCAERIFDAAAGLPPVALLVNNAARFTFDGFGAVSVDQFDSHMAVNVRAPLLLIDALARRHCDGDAQIINILDSKLAAPNPDFLSYTLSKFALAGLGEVAARALADRGIRVNAIAPALMLPSGDQDAANFAATHGHNPLQRGVSVADLVAALRFLVQTPVITGQTIILDSGQRYWGLPRDVQFLADPGDTI